MKENAIIAFGILFYLMLEQVLIKCLELISNSYEPDELFHIWWSVHLIEKIIFFVIKNIYVLYSAVKEFPEFTGNFGKSYPGKQSPRLVRYMSKEPVVLVA